MTVISRLAEFVTQANASALPHAEQALLRRHVRDAVVAGVAAVHTAEGRSLAALYRGRALPDLVGLRAATIRLSEIDDIHLPSCTTPSAGSVACALTLAQQTGHFDPVRVASAIWAGTELMTRLGAAIGGADILYRGVWPSCFAAPLAVAGTAARMRGLDPRQTADALSLALMLSTRGSGRPRGSPAARWVMFATAAAAGVAAVEAIQAGYQGDPALLEDAAFEEQWGFALDRDRLTVTPDASSVYASLSMKPFCSAKQSIAAVEALRTILRSGIPARSIAAVRVRVPPAYAAMIATKAQDGVRTSTLVSVARQLALLAVDPARLYDVDRSAAISDAGILEFEARIEIVADAGLSQYYPTHWPAEVEVVTADGKTVCERVIEAPGDPGRPLDDDALDAKAHGVLDRVIGREAVTELTDIGRRGFADEAGCAALADAFVGAFTAQP